MGVSADPYQQEGAAAADTPAPSAPSALASSSHVQPPPTGSEHAALPPSSNPSYTQQNAPAQYPPSVSCQPAAAPAAAPAPAPAPVQASVPGPYNGGFAPPAHEAYPQVRTAEHGFIPSGAPHPTPQPHGVPPAGPANPYAAPTARAAPPQTAGQFAATGNPYAAAPSPYPQQGAAAANPYAPQAPHGATPYPPQAPVNAYPQQPHGAYPPQQMQQQGGYSSAPTHGAAPYGGPPQPGYPSQVPPVHIRQLANTATGGAMSALGNYKGTYTIYVGKLHGVHEAFNGTKQGWNRNYKAAQTIFSSTIKSSAVRMGIIAEHTALYSTWCTGGVKDNTVNSGQELLDLLHFGQHENSTIFFTYIIDVASGDWRFSHTGKDFLADNLSKHAMHSKASQEVYYAGEFHIECINGRHTLVLDNNSGTYAPDKNLLPTVAALFQRNFPGIPIDAWDREDSRLKAAITACPTR